MSAYTVDKNQIDYIMTARMISENTYTHNYTEEDASKEGQILWNENYKSVNYRYNENNDAPTYEYKTSGFSEMNFLQAIKYLHCLNYQSCEHPNYKKSLASKLIHDMVWEFSSMLPGYDDLDW